MTVGPPVDDFDEPRNNMRTVSGRYLDILDPDPEQIELGDIAHALARICRFGGQTRTVYTVAEHSIHVADQLWRTYGELDLAAAGLMHDATEAYLGDVIRPVKRCVKQYYTLEARWEDAIETRFGLGGRLHDPRVKDVDTAILPWEMVMFRDYRRPTSPPDDIAEAFVEAAKVYGVGRPAFIWNGSRVIRTESGR